MKQKTAPLPLAPISFQIPQPLKASLSNGLRIIIFEDHRLPLVSYRLAFFSGDISDPADGGGISSAMASMLSQGTRNYDSRQLAERIERLGAHISAASSDDFTILSASALSLYGSEVLALMSEMLLAPTFPQKELTLYKENTIENLKYLRSQPNFLANEQTARILYDRHPYSRITPTKEEVQALTREALIDFHKQNLLPNNAIFIAVGDVQPEFLVNELEELLTPWQSGEYIASKHPDPPKRSKRSLTIVDRPGSAQANLVLSNLAIERLSPDYFPVLVMNQVLGAGASSRVFMNLREEKGYTYGAYTRFDTKRLSGDFEATAEVRTAVTGDSLKEFFYELERIRDDKVTEQELADAVNFLTGVFPIRAETQEGLTNLIVNQHLYELPEDYLQTYRDNISAVTIEEVREAANKYLHPDSMAIVIVGDAEEILPQAASYSDQVEIFDTEGKALDISNYGQHSTEEMADVSGLWSLVIDFQGQKLPVSLNLAQNGDMLSGKLETMLGDGEITNGSVKGGKILATAQAEIQGQPVEFNISGKAAGDSISGTLSAPIVPEPLPFSGTRD